MWALGTGVLRAACALNYCASLALRHCLEGGMAQLAGEMDEDRTREPAGPKERLPRQPYRRLSLLAVRVSLVCLCF